MNLPTLGLKVIKKRKGVLAMKQEPLVTKQGATKAGRGHFWRDKWTALSGPRSVVMVRAAGDG